MYTDGGSRGNPGPAAIGVAIYDSAKHLLKSYGKTIGIATNNEAEYEALLAALLICWANPDLTDPIIYSDSTLVVKQVNGLMRCRTLNLEPLYLSVKEIQEVFRFDLQHVPRQKVWEADALANLFLDKLEKQRGKRESGEHE